MINDDAGKLRWAAMGRNSGPRKGGNRRTSRALMHEVEAKSAMSEKWMKEKWNSHPLLFAALEPELGCQSHQCCCTLPLVVSLASSRPCLRILLLFFSACTG